VGSKWKDKRLAAVAFAADDIENALANSRCGRECCVGDAGCQSIMYWFNGRQMS
jgi:hypothetical protein